jgi:hypothetical protein
MFLNRFDVLMLKIIFFFLKNNIILIYFRVKNILNRNHYHISKHSLKIHEYDYLSITMSSDVC